MKFELEESLNEEQQLLLQNLIHNDYNVRLFVLKKLSEIPDVDNYPSIKIAYHASEKLQEAAETQGSNKKPIKLCKESIKLEPKFSAPYVFLSYLYRYYHKKYGAAKKSIQNALKIEPDNEYAWIEFRRVLVEQNDAIGAAYAFNKAITINSEIKDLEPYARLFDVFQRLGMSDRAEDALIRLQRAGVGLDPGEENKWIEMVIQVNLIKLEKQ